MARAFGLALFNERGSQLGRPYWPRLSSLASASSHMTTVGEPIEPAVWKWYHEVVGKGEAVIVDTWWQTGSSSHEAGKRGAGRARRSPDHL